MTQIFFDFLGEYATRLIDFYRENQAWLNIIVLAYGVLLALAHRNIKRLEAYLRELAGSSDMTHIWKLMESEELEGLDLEKFKRELRIPILASPYHFSFYTVTLKSILRILRKKYPGSK